MARWLAHLPGRRYIGKLQTPLASRFFVSTRAQLSLHDGRPILAPPRLALPEMPLPWVNQLAAAAAIDK